MRKVWLIILALLILVTFGCQRQEAALINIQTEQTPSPTGDFEAASAEPSWTLELELPVITGEDFTYDALGVPILNEEEHYFSYYLEFSALRVYEYGNSTFLDGRCFNSFITDLEGRARICFYGEDGRLYGYGEILTAEESLTLPAGIDTPIYAEIFSEIPVVELDYVIEIVTPFMPAEGV
ncbi:MAG: hypothetical protein Q4C04_01420 [Clostridia bacterium]|nr:hypothetical protein [Clostridia bacterium]